MLRTTTNISGTIVKVEVMFSTVVRTTSRIKRGIRNL